MSIFAIVCCVSVGCCVLEYTLKDYSITKTTAPSSVQKLSGTNVDILLKNGINYTNGSGSSEFSQISYKMGFEYEIIDQLILRTNYELRYKTVGPNSTKNSMVILNLGYKF